MLKKTQYIIGLSVGVIMLIGLHLIIFFEDYEIQSFIGSLSLSSSCHILILTFLLKLNILLERPHFAIFPVKYKDFIIIKIRHLLFKKYYIILLLFSSFSFIGDFQPDLQLSFFIFITTFIQYIFAIMLFFVLWDILNIHRLSKHVDILFFVCLFPTILLGDSSNYELLLFNPITTSLSIPLYIHKYNNILLLTASIIVIPLALYILNTFLLKNVKQWI